MLCPADGKIPGLWIKASLTDEWLSETEYYRDEIKPGKIAAAYLTILCEPVKKLASTYFIHYYPAACAYACAARCQKSI